MVVSCVTFDPPYRPHPHNLVGKEGCKKGVCTIPLGENMTVSFPNLGIQCVKKKDIDESLTLRQQIRVDPFQSKCFLKIILLRALKTQLFQLVFPTRVTHRTLI